MDDQVKSVPLAAFEAQGERSTRIIAHMAVGWCISVVILAVVLLFAISYQVETVEETTTTDVEQEATTNGINYYSGGDMVNDEPNDQDNENGQEING